MKIRIVVGVSVIVLILAMADLFVSNAQQAAGELAQPAGNGAPLLSTRSKWRY